MHYLIPLLMILLSYLLGSVNGSLMLGRFKNVDIRKSGSGNAGGTNALRTQGFKFALAAVVIDILKGVLAVTLIPYIFVRMNLLDTSLTEIVILLCGVAVVVGHVFPVWHGFKGGKGAGTLIGVLLVLTPSLIVYLLLIFFTLVVLTGYVGPNTVVVGFSASIIYAIQISNFLQSQTFWFLLAMGLFVAFTHRENIKRLVQGNENRFEKARLLHRLFRKVKGQKKSG